MRILRFSDRGPAVALLQLALVRASFGPLVLDGIFGLRTQEALRHFQLARGLTADGVAGRATHEALLPWYTGYLRHRVRAGESFYSIARLYGARTEAVELANSALDPGNIPVGALVTVPLPFPVVPTEIPWCSALAAYCVRGLCARYPFLSCASVGRSALGRPLWSLSLGAGENRVLYNAAHHANEWITTPLLLSFVEELAESFAQGGTIFGQSAAELLDYARLCLVPLVNPDGLDLVTGELQRGEAYENARAMAALTRRFDPALTLSFHTQGEVIYWRFGDYEIPGARDIAATFAAVSGYSLEETPYDSSFAGYRDWFIQSFRRPGFTIECGRGINPLPLADFPEIRRRCLGILTLGALVT